MSCRRRRNSRACNARQVLLCVFDHQFRFRRDLASTTTRLLWLTSPLGFAGDRPCGARTTFILAGNDRSETLRLCACDACRQAICSRTDRSASLHPGRCDGPCTPRSDWVLIAGERLKKFAQDFRALNPGLWLLFLVSIGTIVFPAIAALVLRTDMEPIWACRAFSCSRY
jgi:hypothetical protein